MTPESDDTGRESHWSPLWKYEDWWAIWIGAALLIICLLAVASSSRDASGPDESVEFSSPLKDWISKPGGWDWNPRDSIGAAGLAGIGGVFVASAILFGLALQVSEGAGLRFLLGFPCVFALATIAYVLAGQSYVKHYGLSYALWALLAGLVISNTIRTPAFVSPAVRTELYIKTGLVIFGAEVLFSKLLALGVPGIFVSWFVTPVVLITTFWFGQHVLKIASPSLNMVISADMSVCGVSAAIATAAACKAKKEELSVAIAMSLTFTVVMMVVMPIVIRATGMSEVLGGAWMGGTIDASGAVAAAGEMLGEGALAVAMTVKMIQNILIGVIAFGVAVYWVTKQAPDESGDRPGLSEIWIRFPKFVLGFLAASIAFSLIYSLHADGHDIVGAVISDSTKTLRGWFFCLAFVSIGLDSDFRKITAPLKGGKPLLLYLVGQTFNLILTLFVAWLMFEKAFPDAAELVQ